MAVDVRPDPQAIGENPLIEGLERLPVPATTLTIFGVTGDLAHRKLLPALYNLAHEGALPERFNLVGISRRDQSDQTSLPRISVPACPTRVIGLWSVTVSRYSQAGTTIVALGGAPSPLD